MTDMSQTPMAVKGDCRQGSQEPVLGYGVPGTNPQSTRCGVCWVLNAARSQPCNPKTHAMHHRAKSGSNKPTAARNSGRSHRKTPRRPAPASPSQNWSTCQSWIFSAAPAEWLLSFSYVRVACLVARCLPFPRTHALDETESTTPAEQEHGILLNTPHGAPCERSFHRWEPHSSPDAPGPACRDRLLASANLLNVTIALHNTSP